MKWHRYLIILILVTGLRGISGVVVDSLVVKGNQITRYNIIAREVSHPIPAEFDSAVARLDRNRVYNMGIFESVAIYPLEDSGVVYLVVEVIESFRMLPLPLFYYQDDVGWSYGGAASYRNFRGLNQQLLLSATLGGEKTYRIVFSDPWLFGDRIAMFGQAGRTYRGHATYDFRHMIQIFELGLGKASSDNTFIAAGTFNVQQREVKWSDLTGPGTPDGPRRQLNHHFAHIRFSLLWRTTDIWRDPTRGAQLGVAVSTTQGLDDPSPSYNNLIWEAAWFRALTDRTTPLVLGIGLKWTYYDRDTPVYLHQFIGRKWVRGYSPVPGENHEKVRGRLEKTSVANIAFELRRTLIPRTVWYQVAVGLSGVLFVDHAWGYGPDAPLAEAMPVTGFGAGLRLFLPFIELLAFDIGTNRYDYKLHYIWGISHKF